MSTKDQSFSRLAPHWRRPVLAIGQDYWINDFTATKTTPTKKEYRPCVIPKVFKGFVDHIAFATRTFHGTILYNKNETLCFIFELYGP